MKFVRNLPIRLALLLAAGGAPASAPAQLGLAVPAGGSPASAVLVATSAAEAIRTCAHEARNQLVFDIENRLKVAAGEVGVLASAAGAWPEEARERFQDAWDEMRVEEAALRMNLEGVPGATVETWPQVRAALAFSYVNLIGAVSRVELAAASARSAAADPQPSTPPR